MPGSSFRLRSVPPISRPLAAADEIHQHFAASGWLNRSCRRAVLLNAEGQRELLPASEAAVAQRACGADERPLLLEDE